MASKHIKFDEQKLFARKDHHCGFRYCPLCGRDLAVGTIDGQERVYCPDENCGYVFYQNPIPAAGAILIENDRVLLVKRAHPPKIGWWCLPAGFMEWREHPSETAVRELAEETGLEIKLTSFFEVYSGQDDPRSNAILILYLADIIGGELRAADDAEEVAWHSLDDLPDQIAFESHIQALADYNRRYRNKS
jgi:ADP-ribose pyrophosphatase YjhB (NUDIX family)